MASKVEMADIIDKENLIRLLNPEERFAFAIELLQAAATEWKGSKEGVTTIGFTITWGESLAGIDVERRQVAKVGGEP